MVPIALPPRSSFFFTVTSWELTTLRHLHRSVEDHLDELLRRYEVADGEMSPGAIAKAKLDLMLIEARVPALFRVPMLTMAWGLYESCVVEVSSFFERKLGLAYSLATPDHEVPPPLKNKWRRWSTDRRAKHFFETELALKPVARDEDEKRLDELRRLRNVLAHGGGRRPSSKMRDWENLLRIARQREHLDLDSGFVLASPEFVRSEIDLVERTTSHIVSGARRIVDERQLYD